MRLVKRVLCMVLAVSCVFFTGCNSIIYNGDLHFQSFEPETLPPISDLDPEIEKKIQESNEELDIEKYKVEGRDAFYILPEHENRPDRIIDFKVLDYTDEGRFIYAYLTPYYGKDESGVAVGNREGTAPKERVISTGENSSLNVLVLMSYRPENRAYKVFYSSVLEKSRSQTVVNQEGGNDEQISASVEHSTVMAGKVVKNQNYYLYNNDMMFVYDGQGDEVSRKDYGVAVGQEASRLKEKAKSVWRGKKPESVIQQSEVSVSDVVMDGEGYVYLSVTVELPDDDDDGGGEEDLENADEDEASKTTFTSIIACYDLDIGGGSWVEFVSDSENWKDQTAYWKACGGNFDSRKKMNQYMAYTMDQIKQGKLDDILLDPEFEQGKAFEEWEGESEEFAGSEDGGSEESEEDFGDGEGESEEDFGEWEGESEEDFGEWEGEPEEDFGDGEGESEDTFGYGEEELEESSQDQKNEPAATLADRFSAFRTISGGLNMELAGIADLSSFQVDVMDKDHNFVRSEELDLYDLVFGKYDDWYWNMDWKTYRFLNRWRYSHRWWWSSLHWWSEKEDLKKVFSLGKQHLTLLAQGDQDAIRYLDLDDLETGSYLMIPWLRPSEWDSAVKSNAVPTTDSRSNKESFQYLLGALFAYKTSVYKDESEELIISRFSNVETEWEPDELGRDDLILGRLDYPLFTLDPKKQEDHILMEVSQWSEGNEERTFTYIKDGEVQESITQTLDKYPIQYRLRFPENTRIYWTESVDTGEMAAASGNLGCIYYEEKPQTEQEIKDQKPVFSKIRYNDGGTADVLSDSQMPGRAMDAGVLYASQGERASEMVCFITDEGMKFYKRQGGGFPADRALYVPMANLSRAASSYRLSLQGETAMADGMDVPKEQDEIIKDKTENGVASDSYKVENLSLLNSRDVLVSSLSNGILLVNTDNGLVVSLRSGCYYGTFPYETSQGRKFMVLGYDTEDYSYQPGDIAWSKCYSMDLDGRNAELAVKAMKEYLDSLANSYLSRIHRLTWSEGDKKYEILEPTDEEKKDNNQAKKLFYGTEADQEGALREVLKSMGASRTPAEIKDYAGEIREKLQAQRQALAEIYRLAGLGPNIPFPPANPELLEQEGFLITAAYEKTLEHILVDLKLSDGAISRMEPSRQTKYREYQKEKAAARLLNSQGSGYHDSKKAENALNKPWDPDMKVDNELAAIENMACYETVLNGIRRDYLNSLNPPGLSEERGGDENLRLTAEETARWEAYLGQLLKRVSPDHSVNESEKGLEELCGLTGLSLEIVDQDKMIEKISGMRYLWQMEELILEEILNRADYQGSSYRNEFNQYKETLFDTDSARGEAFRSGKYYEIIQEKKEEFHKDKAKDWDQKMAEIMGQCGAPIVLDLNRKGQE